MTPQAIYCVTDYLTLVAKLKKRPCVEQFLLDYGRSYAINTKTYESPRAAQGLCFMNATLDAFETERTYVEGYIMVWGCPIEHAWTVDASGQVYDQTLEPNEEIGGYYGVPFKTEYLRQSALHNGYYGLFGHRSKSRQALIEGKIKTTEFKAEGQCSCSN